MRLTRDDGTPIRPEEVSPRGQMTVFPGIPGGATKPLLKTFAGRFFSSDFVHRRKVGLTIPLAEWLDSPAGLGRYLEALSEPNAKLAGYGDRAKIREIVQRFRNGDRSVARILVHLLNIETWLRSIPRWSIACIRKPRACSASAIPSRTT